MTTPINHVRELLAVPVSEPRLVSYGLNMETCTLNLGGEEYYYDLKATTIDGGKPVAAQEPVGEMVGHHRVGAGEMPTIRWRDGYWPTIGTQFYANTEPCARCAELEKGVG